jgi:hypothetical protein
MAHRNADAAARATRRRRRAASPAFADDALPPLPSLLLRGPRICDINPPFEPADMGLADLRALNSAFYKEGT